MGVPLPCADVERAAVATKRLDAPEYGATVLEDALETTLADHLVTRLRQGGHGVFHGEPVVCEHRLQGLHVLLPDFQAQFNGEPRCEIQP